MAGQESTTSRNGVASKRKRTPQSSLDDPPSVDDHQCKKKKPKSQHQSEIPASQSSDKKSDNHTESNDGGDEDDSDNDNDLDEDAGQAENEPSDNDSVPNKTLSGTGGRWSSSTATYEEATEQLEHLEAVILRSNNETEQQSDLRRLAVWQYMAQQCRERLAELTGMVPDDQKGADDREDGEEEEEDGLYS